MRGYACIKSIIISSQEYFIANKRYLRNHFIAKRFGVIGRQDVREEQKEQKGPESTHWVLEWVPDIGPLLDPSIMA